MIETFTAKLPSDDWRVRLIEAVERIADNLDDITEAMEEEHKCRTTQPTAPTPAETSGVSADIPSSSTAATRHSGDSSGASAACVGNADGGSSGNRMAAASRSDPLAAMEAAVEALDRARDRYLNHPYKTPREIQSARALACEVGPLLDAWPAVHAEVGRLAREVKEERRIVSRFMGAIEDSAESFLTWRESLHPDARRHLDQQLCAMDEIVDRLNAARRASQESS